MNFELLVSCISLPSVTEFSVLKPASVGLTGRSTLSILVVLSASLLGRKIWTLFDSQAYLCAATLPRVRPQLGRFLAGEWRKDARRETPRAFPPKSDLTTFQLSQSLVSAQERRNVISSTTTTCWPLRFPCDCLAYTADSGVDLFGFGLPRRLYGFHNSAGVLRGAIP